MLKESKHQSSNYVIALVSFKPTQSRDDKDSRQIAHTKVHNMFKECFHDGNMNKIDVCMNTFPMMAIFLSKKLNTGSGKEKSSIFDKSP